LQRAFSLDAPMGTSLKLSYFANSSNAIGVILALSKTIHFGSLEFIVDRLGILSLSHNERDSSAIFVGMVHTGSMSSHTTPKDSTDESGTTSGVGGSSGSPDLEGATW
jgi:hypothetical protein